MSLGTRWRCHSLIFFSLYSVPARGLLLHPILCQITCHRDRGYQVLGPGKGHGRKQMASWRGQGRTLYKVVGQLKKTHKEQRPQRFKKKKKCGKLIPPQQMEEGWPELNKISSFGKGSLDRSYGPPQRSTTTTDVCPIRMWIRNSDVLNSLFPSFPPISC